MTGISTLNSRRLPASVSKSAMAVAFGADSSIMARHGLDGGDDFFFGRLVGDAQETRVAAIHQNTQATIGIAAQSGDQRPARHVTEGSVIHGQAPSSNEAVDRLATSMITGVRKRSQNQFDQRMYISPRSHFCPARV